MSRWPQDDAHPDWLPGDPLDGILPWWKWVGRCAFGIATAAIVAGLALILA